MTRRWLVVVLAAGLITGVPIAAQDGEEDSPASFFGFVDLDPPADAENQDADGVVHLLETVDRMAIHVSVSGLEPGATYDVQIGDQSIGTITTYDGEPSETPRCFRSRLALQDDEGDGADEEGEAAQIRQHRRGGRGPAERGSAEARGFARIIIGEDVDGGTEITYHIHVGGLNGDVAMVILQIGDESIELDPEALRGTLVATASQLAAIIAGEASVIVTTDQAEELSGTIEPCFTEEERAELAERRAGRGSLRIDTADGDEMPLDAGSLADLEGATAQVVNADGAVVLTGVIEERLVGGRGRHGGFGPGIGHRHGGTALDHDCDADAADGGGDEGDDEVDDGNDGEAEAGGEEPVEAAIAALEASLDAAFFSVGTRYDGSFRRGDVNADGNTDLSDAVGLLVHLFAQGPAPRCEDAADVNDDGALNLSDALLLLGSLFGGTSAGQISAMQGFDPTPDDLYCSDTES